MIVRTASGRYAQGFTFFSTPPTSNHLFMFYSSFSFLFPSFSSDTVEHNSPEESEASVNISPAVWQSSVSSCSSFRRWLDQWHQRQSLAHRQHRQLRPQTQRFLAQGPDTWNRREEKWALQMVQVNEWYQIRHVKLRLFFQVKSVVKLAFWDHLWDDAYFPRRTDCQFLKTPVIKTRG